jgi:ferredoxin-NADP reductase
MGLTDWGTGPADRVPPVPEAPFRKNTFLPRDIDVLMPQGKLPVSRGAPERKLERTDRYDRRARVIGYESLTETGTVRIFFEVVDDQPFVFTPGYFVGIKATVDDVGECKSPYCIVSCPNDHRTFTLLVRLVPTGPLSYYLGELDVGDVINFRGPAGRCMAPKEDGTELVLMATGVGIGPFLGLVEYLAGRGFDRPIRLYWGLRLVEDICLLDELEYLASVCPQFSYDISLSEPPCDWPGLRGRITESVPPLLDTLGEKHYYLVGNGHMTEEMGAVLSDLGVDERLVYHEVYFNSRYRPDPRSLAEIRNRFVACDLFSPYTHQQANLFMPERSLQARARDC